MTAPGGAPPPVAPTPAVAAADETVIQAPRLGLTWALRPGTVQSPPTDDPTATSVLLDGDTAPVSAFSLVGLAYPGARVMTMRVPPSGLYITGYVGPGPAGDVLGGARATATAGIGFILTTSAGTEANISQLALNDMSVSVNNAYSFMGTVVVNGGSEADSFQFRWRKGTPLTGAIVGSFFYLPESSGFNNSQAFDTILVPTSSDTDNYYLSVQRIAGGGALSIYGLSLTHARLEHIGSYTPGASLFTDRL